MTDVHVHPAARAAFMHKTMNAARLLPVRDRKSFLMQHFNGYCEWLESIDLPPERLMREVAVLEAAFSTLLPPPRGQARRA